MSPQPHNTPSFSVSEISLALKRTVEESFSHVRVRGEISGWKVAASGHVYLSLKDEQAVLSAVCWKGVANRFPFAPEDGLEVICTGKITTYPGRSTYQLVIETMEPAGVGALMALLEKRKKQLAAEGLFSPERKKPLPYLPRIIGVVTSPTGAVIRDILHRLEDRFPCHVLIWPVLVQGEQAAEQIASAIAGFNTLPEDGKIPKPDLLIVARGGGSLEDLWAFNEEIVVRAAAGSSIPLISAVGHETDTTLIDYAADRRAPTPTAAAEMAVPVREELLLLVEDRGRRMARSVKNRLAQQQQTLEGLARGLPRPAVLLQQAQERLDGLRQRLARALPQALERQTRRLAVALAGLRIQPLRQELTRQHTGFLQLEKRLKQCFTQILTTKRKDMVYFAQLLESYHYKKVLERGFALVRDKHKKPVTSAKAILPGQAYQVEFQDGERQVVAVSSAAPKKKKGENSGQGSLF